MKSLRIRQLWSWEDEREALSISREVWWGDQEHQQTQDLGRARIAAPALTTRERRVLRKGLAKRKGVQLQWVQVQDRPATPIGRQNSYWACTGNVLRPKATPVPLLWFSAGPIAPIPVLLNLIDLLKRSAKFKRVSPAAVRVPASLWARILEGRIDQVAMGAFPDLEARVAPEGDSDLDESFAPAEWLVPTGKASLSKAGLRFNAVYFCNSNGLLCRDGQELEWVWIDFPDPSSLPLSQIQFQARRRMCPLPSGWVSIADGVWMP